MCKKCCFETHIFTKLPTVGGHPLPRSVALLPRFAPSLWPPSKIPGYTTVTGVDHGAKGAMPPPPVDRRVKNEKGGVEVGDWYMPLHITYPYNGIQCAKMPFWFEFFKFSLSWEALGDICPKYLRWEMACIIIPPPPNISRLNVIIIPTKFIFIGVNSYLQVISTVCIKNWYSQNSFKYRYDLCCKCMCIWYHIKAK